MVRSQLIRGAAALLMLGMSASAIPAGALADTTTYTAGLVTLCSTDTFVRVGGINLSPADVLISLPEKDKDGKRVDLLGSNASQELVSIFPIAIPANTKYAVTWDLPLPAHNTDGSARKVTDPHGSWSNRVWLDENGLTYKGTGGTAGNNGNVCKVPTPAPTATPEPTKEPTAEPTKEPTKEPTAESTPEPTKTEEPTKEPTAEPTKTEEPTVEPTKTEEPTAEPTKTQEPTKEPTVEPTATPSDAPYAAVAAANSTLNSTRAAYAIDLDKSTSWYTEMADGAIPTWAWVSLDLGAVKPVQRIDWLWSETGFADDMRIEISLDGAKWQTIGSPNNGPVWDWQSLKADVKARYVRFYFRNPNNDPQLGYLAEVMVYAFADAGPSPDPDPEVTVTPPPTIEPGTPLKIVASKRSSNSRAVSSRSAWDRRPTTAWHTEMSTAPKSGWVSFDLGETKPIGKVKWQFNQLGYADKFKIQVSNDGVHWTTVAVRKNPSAANTWQTLKLSGVNARYVRFFFNNPNQDANVGWLSEVRFYA